MASAAGLGKRAYDNYVDEIRWQQQQPENRYLRDVDPEDLLAVRGFTEEIMGDGGTRFPDVKSWASDYKLYNRALRIGDAEQLKPLEVGIRLAANGMQYMPQYRGVTFTGIGLDSPFQHKPGEVYLDEVPVKVKSSSKWW